MNFPNECIANISNIPFLLLIKLKLLTFFLPMWLSIPLILKNLALGFVLHTQSVLNYASGIYYAKTNYRYMQHTTDEANYNNNDNKNSLNKIYPPPNGHPHSEHQITGLTALFSCTHRARPFITYVEQRLAGGQVDHICNPLHVKITLFNYNDAAASAAALHFMSHSNTQHLAMQNASILMVHDATGQKKYMQLFAVIAQHLKICNTFGKFVENLNFKMLSNLRTQKCIVSYLWRKVVAVTFSLFYFRRENGNELFCTKQLQQQKETNKDKNALAFASYGHV